MHSEEDEEEEEEQDDDGRKAAAVSDEDAFAHAESVAILAPLVDMLTDPLPHARGGAARVLACAAPTLTAPHLPRLVALAADPVPWVRHAAAVAAGKALHFSSLQLSFGNTFEGA